MEVEYVRLCSFLLASYESGSPSATGYGGRAPWHSTSSEIVEIRCPRGEFPQGCNQSHPARQHFAELMRLRLMKGACL